MKADLFVLFCDGRTVDIIVGGDAEAGDAAGKEQDILLEVVWEDVEIMRFCPVAGPILAGLF